MPPFPFQYSNNILALGCGCWERTGSRALPRTVVLFCCWPQSSACAEVPRVLSSTLPHSQPCARLFPSLVLTLLRCSQTSPYPSGHKQCTRPLFLHCKSCLQSVTSAGAAVFIYSSDFHLDSQHPRAFRGSRRDVYLVIRFIPFCCSSSL